MTTTAATWTITLALIALAVWLGGRLDAADEWRTRGDMTR